MQALVSSETVNVKNLNTNIGTLKTDVGSLGSQVAVFGSTIAFMVNNSTWDYASGWADGGTYNQWQQTSYLGTLIAPCLAASTNTFTVAGSTFIYDTSISTQTCADVVTTIQNELWVLIDSITAIMPGQLRQETSE